MTDTLQTKVARAIYEAQHFAGPVGNEPIEWGRGGFKTGAVVWEAAASAAIAVVLAERRDLDTLQHRAWLADQTSANNLPGSFR